MAETIRSYSQFIADYADNNTRNITEQVGRDLVHSLLAVSPYVAKSTGYTATESDEVIDCDATSAGFTITLPAAATTRVGKRYTIRKIDSSVNAVVVDANASELIDLDTTQILFTQHAYLTIINTGAAWRIVASYGVVSGHIFITTASATIASTVTETTIIGTGIGNLTLPANFFRIGKTIDIYAAGVISDTATPNIRFRVKLGSTVIIDTTAIALAGTLANTGWELHASLTCRAVGGGGSVFGQGGFEYGASNRIPLAATAAVTVDTTVSQVLSVTEEWGTNSASNTITCSNFIAERKN